jgi:hypothetical protein
LLASAHALIARTAATAQTRRSSRYQRRLMNNARTIVIGELPMLARPQVVVGRSTSESYVARHWRGELTLSTSFWINCCFLSVALSFALLLVPDDPDWTRAPRLIAASMILMWLGLTAITAWQCVGTWRSAGYYVEGGGHRVWAGVTRGVIVLDVVATVYTLVAVAAPQSLEFAQIALNLDGSEAAEIEVSSDGRRLIIDGGIGFGLSDKVVAVLDANTTIGTIELTSQGGRLGEARKLAALIESRSLNTVVVDECMSACTIAFIAGEQRHITRTAILGFHRSFFPGTTDDALYEVERAERQFMARRGLPVDFVRRVYDTPNEEMWEPSHEELFRARVATGYAEVEQR